MRVIYLDTSAAITLFTTEQETAALEAWLSSQGSAITLTCDLTRTELLRALNACHAEAQVLHDAEEWLEDRALIRMPPALFTTAGTLAPGTRLRSLDALHCAAALSLGPAVVAFVTYDKRLAECAHSLHLPVHSPA